MFYWAFPIFFFGIPLHLILLGVFFSGAPCCRCWSFFFVRFFFGGFNLFPSGFLGGVFSPFGETASRLTKTTSWPPFPLFHFFLGWWVADTSTWAKKRGLPPVGLKRGGLWVVFFWVFCFSLWWSVPFFYFVDHCCLNVGSNTKGGLGLPLFFL